MNLTNFLKQTDALTAQYSIRQLTSFIHEIGRVLPERHREDFLKRLRSIGGETEIMPNKNEVGNFEFNTTYQMVQNNLEKIGSHEVTITGIWNEGYDDWYDGDGEELIYEDEDGVSDMLAQACDFVHTCVDEEMYEEGFAVGRQLFFIRVLCWGECGDEELSVEDMVNQELLYCNMKQIILDALYCAYHATPLRRRPEALYEVIVNAGSDEILLESVMQHGDADLPDFQDFLAIWITYLGDRTGHDADRLFSEAVNLLNHVSAACKYAEKFVVTHPGLYLDILENEKNIGLEDRVSIGIQAMGVIPKKYVVRSKVALKTADCIIRSNKQQDMLETCYFAAYESDTSAVNYIRVLLNGYGTRRKREELRNVYMSLPVNENGVSFGWIDRQILQSERGENKPDRNTILMIKFFDGQFAEVSAQGLDQRKPLGWSGTFMKQGIALYLLCLHEGEWLDRGILAMADVVKARMGFSVEEYQKGLSEGSDANENDLFFNVFSKWKSLIVMEPDVRTQAIEKIENLIEQRTKGIMEANRRNYYGECAAYIAALGEVEESLGDKGAKQRLMTSYRDKYTRRSAFRAEMRGYGWIDVKKK